VIEKRRKIARFLQYLKGYLHHLEGKRPRKGRDELGTEIGIRKGQMIRGREINYRSTEFIR